MFPFESLEVYKKAFRFHNEILNLLKNCQKSPTYLKNQLGRAALSIVLNIAEGSAKFSSKDRKNFLVIARGSVFECSALIQVFHSENLISERNKMEQLETLEELSKMLYTMIKNLEVK